MHLIKCRYSLGIQEIASHKVPPLSHPIRIQEYAVGIFQTALTKSALKKKLKKGLVTVDERVATTATIIKGGEYIRLHQVEDLGNPKTFKLPLKVLFEDDYLAMIHKPAGIAVSGNKLRTITNALNASIAKSPLTDATTPQAIHRLDYATSGILLVGKTSTSIRELNRMFEERKIQKTYFAITIGIMKRSGRVMEAIDGKFAESEFEVIQSVHSERFDRLNLVKLHPKTGRRHQLRKHLLSIGNPILGDKQYGIDGLILSGKGMYLFAYSLEFTHPKTGKHVLVSDPIPKKFLKIFKIEEDKSA
jgi:23S rRNA pseudouridine1911/1915/1917 synthase